MKCPKSSKKRPKEKDHRGRKQQIGNRRPDKTPDISEVSDRKQRRGKGGAVRYSTQKRNVGNFKATGQQEEEYLGNKTAEAGPMQITN